MTRPFRFAVQSYTAASAAEWRSQVRKAEDLGFSALHLADHVIGPGPALTPTNHPVQHLAAVPAMGMAIECTERMRVGCRVFCCDYRNPALFAKELATLDLLSGGRLEIGLGAGWLANEYDAMGVPFQRPGARIDRLVETLAVLRACFGEGEVDVRGQHVHAVGFEGVPKPVQRPGPPVMIGGGSRRVLGVAGREADIVSLNFDNSSGRIGPEGVGSSTADATAEKIEWIKAGAGERFDDLELETAAYFTVVTDDRDGTLGRMADVLGLSPDELAEHPNALVGPIVQLCDQLVERRERYGISYVTFGYTVVDQVAPIVDRLAGT